MKRLDMTCGLLPFSCGRPRTKSRRAWHFTLPHSTPSWCTPFCHGQNTPHPQLTSITVGSEWLDLCGKSQGLLHTYAKNAKRRKLAFMFHGLVAFNCSTPKVKTQKVLTESVRHSEIVKVGHKRNLSSHAFLSIAEKFTNHPIGKIGGPSGWRIRHCSGQSTHCKTLYSTRIFMSRDMRKQVFQIRKCSFARVSLCVVTCVEEQSRLSLTLWLVISQLSDSVTSGIVSATERGLRHTHIDPELKYIQTDCAVKVSFSAKLFN